MLLQALTLQEQKIRTHFYVNAYGQEIDMNIINMKHFPNPIKAITDNT